ncbi:helix-turn-helix domain-containing protein [Variovorax saccharolyticus]|uniref:helix-turn-helix domain-containing protein n=1 Tax=Variovorax saccharolyticus TaxID=3053516 RepID=UPI0025784409|nr:AraC family transcriptional regulator [Variovorax sp. J22R187]MDM0020027.1 AraC family transcriptional regulator [Variovorax sp. J22R187]
MADTFKTSRAKRGAYKTSRSARSAAGSSKSSANIQPLGYSPRASYALDLEVFTVSDLRHRGSKAKVRTTHRYEFHTLVCVTQGACTQVVDFKSICCQPGSLLVLRPGQAHNYGSDEDWDGLNVLFRPEFVLPVSATMRDSKLAVDLARLPEHVLLGSDDLRRVTDSIQQMREDTLIDAPLEDVHALLRHQLHALLTRLSILQGRQQAQDPLISTASQRFKRFQQLVEERFSRWHQVADYASQLGYTEKSLARAVTGAMGMTAKAFIAARVNLEAKRLLVHTDMPGVAIAEKLGFEEATNFSKFFKREVGCTPAEFRRRQRLPVAPATRA